MKLTFVVRPVATAVSFCARPRVSNVGDQRTHASASD